MGSHEWPPEAGPLWVPDTEDARQASEETAEFKRGFDSGYHRALQDSPAPVEVTEESRERAAKFLYRKDAPVGEPVNAWDTATDKRREIYFHSAEMIARLFNGWPV